jgi:hypothetical protein
MEKIGNLFSGFVHFKTFISVTQESTSKNQKKD